MTENPLDRRRLLKLTGAASASALLLPGGAAAARTRAGSPAGVSTATAASRATIKVSGEQWGHSTRYIGADRGITNFDIRDFHDLGMNTYRYYGGMANWEYEDDDGQYGLPSIEAIKSDPGLVNWAWWDRTFTDPPEGSAYWYATEPGVGWQGSMDKMLRDMKGAGVKPMISLRVQNAQRPIQPEWSARLNPPDTPEGRNEWWQHVFSVVYWMNVRNDYRVDDWEHGNEPNYYPQGWRGTIEDYWEFVKLTHDAIDHVYKKYLPGRTYQTYAPVVTTPNLANGVRYYWIREALRRVPEYFDHVDYHDFGDDPSGRINEVHQIMNEAGQGDRQLWLTEWGPNFKGADSFLKVSNGVLMIKNLIRMSWPGDQYVYGNHLVNLYDSPTRPYLIGPDGERRVTYYAMRMGIRALQGGRPTFESIASSPDIVSMTTQDDDGSINLLVTNSSPTRPYVVRADLSELADRAKGTLWEFSDAHHDRALGMRPLRHGETIFRLPQTGAVLIKFTRG